MNFKTVRKKRSKTHRWNPASFAVWTATALSSLLLILTSCTPIPRARTLPPTIRSVYVPMFVNETSEPGLEELATRATQREFLADGRLRLESKQRADAWIECVIKSFENRPTSHETDDFPTFTTMSLNVDVAVRENIPTTPLLGGRRKVAAQFSYFCDVRRSMATLDVEAMDRLMEDLARMVVREVLTGEYGKKTFEGSGSTALPAPDEEALPSKD